MVFYVYFDPHVISVAKIGGACGLPSLVGILRGFEANCLLAEFDDYFVQEELRNQLNGLEDDDTRKVLKSLFATLQKRNRFVYVFASRDVRSEMRVVDALLQGKKAELDLIFTENPVTHPNPCNIAVCGLQAYQTGYFEMERNAVATGGRTFAANLYEASAFLNWTLRKAMKHCEAVNVYDRYFGERFRGNFDYSARAFFDWLETFIHAPGKLRLTFYCGLPDGYTGHFIQNQLSSYRRGCLTNVPITINFYDTASGIETLPHQRYLVTDQIAIDLGRGMDFIDPHTQKNREGKFSFARADELNKMLASLPPPSRPAVSF